MEWPQVKKKVGRTGLNNMLLINLQKLRNNMFLNIINIFIIIIYSKCQSSIFLFADWTKLYHVPVHKTLCSLHVLVRDNWSTMKQLLTVVNNKTRSKAQAFRTNRKVQSSYKSFSMSAGRCYERTLVLCAGVLPELRQFFRRRSRILYAGAGVTFSQLWQNDKKTI
jgi:hypothetical protein